MTTEVKPIIELWELFEAYFNCRQNKRNTLNALAFEIDYEPLLIELCNAINNGTYLPGRSIAFVVNKPVKREIFAADFKDRIVHHFVYNKLNPLFEKEFIYDSYACRLGKGASMGVQRIDRGSPRNWDDLPFDKSLFHTKAHCGLPIGNLTSQVFANFYMNSFDHFMKHNLGVRFYGRYVDDFVVIHQDKAYLQSLVPIMSQYVTDHLHLTLHPNKFYLQHFGRGVKFLGIMIKPHRQYIGQRLKGNFLAAFDEYHTVAKSGNVDVINKQKFLSTMNSYMGMMKNYDTYRLRRKMLMKRMFDFRTMAYLSHGLTKFVLRGRG